jgi:hypothetical protein
LMPTGPKGQNSAPPLHLGCGLGDWTASCSAARRARRHIPGGISRAVLLKHRNFGDERKMRRLCEAANGHEERSGLEVEGVSAQRQRPTRPTPTP